VALAPGGEARRLFDEALSALPNPLPADDDKRAHALMGAVMPALRGRVPGRVVRRWIDETLGEVRP
jgi:Glu-tRNA(Gln) amidotransferase subunit E-like FAD-binding protein